MGQQVGRMGEGASSGLQPQQPHSQLQHPGKASRASGSGRRPKEVATTGTPPGRTAAANLTEPGFNIFTQHSGNCFICQWYGIVFSLLCGTLTGR